MGLSGPPELQFLSRQERSALLEEIAVLGGRFYGIKVPPLLSPALLWLHPPQVPVFPNSELETLVAHHKSWVTCSGLGHFRRLRESLVNRDTWNVWKADLKIGTVRWAALVDISYLTWI